MIAWTKCHSRLVTKVSDELTCQTGDNSEIHGSLDSFGMRSFECPVLVPNDVAKSFNIARGYYDLWTNERLADVKFWTRLVISKP